MKKLIPLMFAFLLLCGCGVKEPEVTLWDITGDGVIDASDNLYHDMGDVNADGTVDENDCALLESIISGEHGDMDYESADLDGNCIIDGGDLALLQKLANGESADIAETRFSAEDTDITDRLIDLGLNNFARWNNSSNEYIISRNPYDMITCKGKVYVSGGNYESNTGPVIMRAYSNTVDGGLSAGVLESEQVDRFYSYDGCIYALGTDPQTWKYGDIYYKTEDAVRWQAKSGVLDGNIHCYDMVKFNGKYFFCGSSIPTGLDNGLSKASVFRLITDSVVTSMMADYKELEVIKKNGEVLDFEDAVATYTMPDGSVRSTALIPRFHDFFAFNDTLYALYYNQYSDGYDKANRLDGLYRYDKETDRFIKDSSKNFTRLTQIMKKTAQDGEKILHDFQWKDKYYFIIDNLYSTSDFRIYRDEKIEGYKDYSVRDAIFRHGKVYLLATKDNGDGSFTNVVLETEDFTSYRPILHFASPLGAKSFELCNGSFYFGLGFTVGKRPSFPENATECGRIYRYEYFTLAEKK